MYVYVCVRRYSVVDTVAGLRTTEELHSDYRKCKMFFFSPKRPHRHRSSQTPV